MVKLKEAEAMIKDFKKIMSIEEIARYLKVEKSILYKIAREDKILATNIIY